MNSRHARGERQRWLVVVLFAAAMAWVESAVVFYLRTMVDRIQPYQPDPLPLATGLGLAELVREAATLVMLFTVGWLAGATRRARIGYALLAFGIWDILYYVFLRIMTGWPRSISDWDILFLIPLPWWGPVWAPVSIALLMVLWGTTVTQCEDPESTPRANRVALGACVAGAILALYVFMADAIQVRAGGVAALRALLPLWFNWPLFLVALGLMAMPVVEVVVQVVRRSRPGAGMLAGKPEKSGVLAGPPVAES